VTIRNPEGFHDPEAIVIGQLTIRQPEFIVEFGEKGATGRP